MLLVRMCQLVRDITSEKGNVGVRCLGYKELAFVDAYRRNKRLGTSEILENNSVAIVMREFMKGRAHWRGYASLLLSGLVDVATTTLKMETHKDKYWPKSPSVLSKRLRELKNSLIERGIQVFWDDVPIENLRVIDIVNVNVPLPSTTSPTPKKGVKEQAVQPEQPVKDDSSTNKTDFTGGTGEHA